MGRCIRCGKIYCNCPTDGICNECALKMSQSSSTTQIATNNPCGITVEDIDKWKVRVECMLSSGAGQAIGLGYVQVNTMYSYVLSMWNYRNTPCMFSQFIPQIQSFMQLLDINNLCAP
jgi:hypothetical protein